MTDQTEIKLETAKQQLSKLNRLWNKLPSDIPKCRFTQDVFIYIILSKPEFKPIIQDFLDRIYDAVQKTRVSQEEIEQLNKRGNEIISKGKEFLSELERLGETFEIGTL